MGLLWITVCNRALPMSQREQPISSMVWVATRCTYCRSESVGAAVWRLLPGERATRRWPRRVRTTRWCCSDIRSTIKPRRCCWGSAVVPDLALLLECGPWTHRGHARCWACHAARRWRRAQRSIWSPGRIRITRIRGSRAYVCAPRCSRCWTRYSTAESATHWRGLLRSCRRIRTRWTFSRFLRVSGSNPGARSMRARSLRNRPRFVGESSEDGCWITVFPRSATRICGRSTPWSVPGAGRVVMPCQEALSSDERMALFWWDQWVRNRRMAEDE